MSTEKNRLPVPMNGKNTSQNHQQNKKKFNLDKTKDIIQKPKDTIKDKSRKKLDQIKNSRKNKNSKKQKRQRDTMELPDYTVSGYTLQKDVKDVPKEYDDENIQSINDRAKILFDEKLSILNCNIISKNDGNYKYVNLYVNSQNKLCYYNSNYRILFTFDYKKSKRTITHKSTDNIEVVNVFIKDNDGDCVHLINDTKWCFSHNLYSDGEHAKRVFTNLILKSLDDVEEYFNFRNFFPHSRYNEKFKNKYHRILEIAEQHMVE